MRRGEATIRNVSFGGTLGGTSRECGVNCFWYCFLVTEEPKSKPILSTEKFKYSVGELIRVNCTSYSGYPSPNITWFINHRQVSINVSMSMCAVSQVW